MKNLQSIWDTAIKSIADSIGPVSLAFLEVVQPREFKDQTLVLAAVSEYVRTMFVSKLKNRICQEMRTLLGTDIQIRFLIDPCLTAKETACAKPVQRQNRLQQAPPSPAPFPPALQHIKLGEADLLVQQHGDIMGVVKNHPLLKRISGKVEQGGWGIWPASITNQIKAHAVDGDLNRGLAIVIAVAREIAGDNSVREPGRVFFTANKRYAQALGNAHFQARLDQLRNVAA